MNPKCPECQTELNEDFGIVTCSNCGAVCSVDLEGNAEVQQKVQSVQDDIHEDTNEDNHDEISDEFSTEDEGVDIQEKTAVDSDLGSLGHDFSSDIEEALEEDLSASSTEDPDNLSDSSIESDDDESNFNSDVGDDNNEFTEQDSEWGDSIEPEEGEASDELMADSVSDGESFEGDSDGDLHDGALEAEPETSEDEFLAIENEDVGEPSEDEAFEEAEPEEGAPKVHAPLSGSGFFKNLELFTEQLEPQDHHHTYYRLKVSGFETESDIEEVLDLTLDDRLGLIKDSLEFNETKQSFVIPKISFLRLVALHKRLSTIHFIKMEWTLSEDQTDTADPEPTYEEGDEPTEIGEAITPNDNDDSVTYEEDVDEFDG